MSSCYLSRTIVRQIGMDPATAVGRTVQMRLDFFDVAATLGLISVNSSVISLRGQEPRSGLTSHLSLSLLSVIDW
jgi:hypothetical protein